MQNLTKYLFLHILLFTICFTAWGQQPPYKRGTPQYLLEKRGFNIFKLGDPIDKYEEYVLLLDDDDKYNDIKTYQVLTYRHPRFATIGDSIEINDIILSEYNGLIISIDVFVDGEYKKPFLRSLQADYGSGHKPNPYTENYNWFASNDKDDIELIYRDNYDGQEDHLNGNGWALFQDVNLTKEAEEQKDINDF